MMVRAVQSTRTTKLIEKPKYHPSILTLFCSAVQGAGAAKVHVFNLGSGNLDAPTQILVLVDMTTSTGVDVLEIRETGIRVTH